MKFIQVAEFGSPEVMTLGEMDKPVRQQGQLLIKVEAVGVNRADILQRQGKYPPPKGESEVLGLEICGEVVEADDCEMLGKKVFGLVAGGGYAQYCLLEQALAFELPGHYSAVQGAAIAEVFLTAYQAMFEIAGLKAQQKALIHAGASGVGSAAIQLAKAIGAEVAVTVGSEQKRDFCMALGADKAINYNTQDFVEQIKTDFGAVDVVVDCIAGDYIARDISCMALDGHIVVLAMMGGRFAESIDMAKMLAKRVSLTASTLRNRTNTYKAQLVAHFKRDFYPLFEKGSLKPVVDSVFDWQDVACAHRFIEENQNKGKVILTLS